MDRHYVGEEYTQKVIDFGMSGEGIVKLDTYPVFVNNALKDEIIKFRLTYVKKDFAFGEIVEIIEPSEFRIKPRCPYYNKCGGCDMQHIEYSQQLEIKRLNIERNLKKIAGLDIKVPMPISLNQWEYRNKLSLPFGKKGDRIVVGFYEKQTHKVVPMKFCPLHEDWAARVIKIITEWANENNISVYNEETHEGFLRHLIVRKIDRCDIVIVGNGDSIPECTSLVLSLKKEHINFGLYFSPNKKEGNVIMGESVNFINGENDPQNINGIKAKISPLSFLQVNFDVMSAIYDDVAKHINGYEGDIIELYSGIGILTASLAKRLPRASFKSVEIVHDAVSDAKKIMNNMELDNVECIEEDAGTFMEKLSFEMKHSSLIIDPPRKGMDLKIIEKALLARFENIIYISCNPSTLARDLKALQDMYYVKYIQPYDMFPQTMHVETVCLLTKK